MAQKRSEAFGRGPEKPKDKLRRTRSLTLAILPILVSVVATLPWLLRPSGQLYDHPLHHRAASEWRHAWACGVAWPAHFDGVNDGLGSFWPSYYPPAFHVGTAAIMSLGPSYWMAAGLVLLAANAVGTCLCYGWLRGHVGAAAGAAGATAFGIAPYTIFNLYHRGAFPESFAIAWLPGIYWAIDGLRRAWSLRHALLGILCTSLITLSNLPALVISIYAIVTYLSVTGLILRDFRGSFRAVSILVAGACLTAFFWMPAWVDQGLVHVPQSDLRGLPASPQFYSLGAFSNEPTRYLLEWCLLLSFVCWDAALLGLVSRVIRPRSAACIGAMAVGGVGLWLCTDLSLFAFRHLPLLARLQFPWRCLGMTSGASALVLAVAVERAGAARILGVTLLVVSVSSLSTIGLARPIDLEAARASATMSDYIPLGARVPGPGRTVLEAVTATSGEPMLEIRRWVPDEIVIDMTARGASNLRVRTFWDPRWVGLDQAGRPLSVSRSLKDPLGRLEIAASAGTTGVHLRLTPTLAARVGRAISIAMAGTLVAAILLQRPDKEPKGG